MLLSGGPTHEAIDPVRYIGNHSSGKMAAALAQALVTEGADVEFVCGPVQISLPHHPAIRYARVSSAGEMYEACIKRFPKCQAAIMAAAVADYTIDRAEGRKIKREKGELSIRLKPTRDIAAKLGQMKQTGQVLIGFALETNHEIENARKKLESKKLDMIVLNSLQDEGAGFGHDTNRVRLISTDSEQPLPLQSKTLVAGHIVDWLCCRLQQ